MDLYPNEWKPKTIVSGGQTGADRGGLEAALQLGTPIDGFAPRGYRSEDGRIPDRYARYLRQHPEAGYPPRTRSNIEMADATLIFIVGVPIGGSAQTVNHCVYREKEFGIIDLDEADNVAIAGRVRRWLEARGIDVLNVAGSRESKVPGIEARVCAILKHALED